MRRTFESIMLSMLQDPPDPSEPLPVSNRKETIWGATIPFLIVCWSAVALRMWVRLRVMHEPGWDDALVVLAVLLNTAATVCMLVSVNYGLGQHFLYLSIPNIVKYLRLYYFMNALYITNTAVIKLSLLAQYLRIFKAGLMHWICISLLVITGLWGLAYGFMAWFPCFPPAAFNDRINYPNATCYGFSFEDETEFISMYQSHTSLNMVLDLTIFLTPMVLFSRPNLRMKNILAMSGIFLLGAVVVLTSAWRLYALILNHAGTRPYIDFTWWSPISIILSCLEIDLAIMCASMPIFWPVIGQSFTAIFVTREVHITEQRRSLADHGLAYELEHGGDAMGRRGSGKSNSATSRESLVITRTGSGKSGKGGRDAESEGDAVEKHYRDPYLAAQVDPFGDREQEEGLGVRTNVDSKPKDKWIL